jgi:hypothetical protein
LVTNLESTEAKAGDKDAGRSYGPVIKSEATQPDNLSQSDETAASKIPAADVTDQVDLEEGDLFAAARSAEKREHKEDVPPRVNPVATQAAEFPSRGKPYVAKDSEKQTSKTARSRRTTSPATVIAGLQRLKSGLSLPLIAWFTPRRLLSGGLMVLIAASLIFGVRALLKIMSANAKSPPNLQSHAVLPPPEPYFD